MKIIPDHSGGDVPGKAPANLPSAPAAVPAVVPSAGNIPPGKKLTGGKRSRKASRKNGNVWV